MEDFAGLRETVLFREFLEIAKELNARLEVTPTLYGSLGLWDISEYSFWSDDIDILVPLIFLEEKWPDLKHVMELLGYDLMDLHEHKFLKKNIEVGFAFVEDLNNFADIDCNELQIKVEKNARYYSLGLEDYLKVYNKSSQDSYRRGKNNGKDEVKIEWLRSMLEKT